MTDSFMRFKQYLSGYTELRKHINTTNVILLLKGNVVTNNVNRVGGVSARAMKNGSWGMSSSPEMGDEAVRNVVMAANSNAGFLDSRLSGTPLNLYSSPAVISKDHRTAKPRVTQKQKLEFLRALDSYILKKYSGLASRMLRFYELDMEKTLLTSDGTEAYSYIPRSHVRLNMTAEKDGRPVNIDSNAVKGGLGEFEDFFGDPAEVYPKIDELYEKLMKKCEGVYADGGVKDVILAPDLAGILAHEAVGHTVESDIVLGGAVSRHLLGKQVASELVTMVDFAHTAFGKTLDVPVYVDDEGVKAEDAVLIEKGVLKDYMLNKQDAHELGMIPKGNARAFGFSDEPLVRMRNTCILPGNSKLEEMIASVEDGYYLEHPGNGQADMTSEFMFAVDMGYEIKNGKLGRAILDTTVSGVAFELLKTVSMISDDLVFISSGFCGKKQPMSVSFGGPAIKCKITIGGK